MATVNPASTQPKTTTADDTLQRKSREAGVISGGHLVAKALKNEGVDTIFTLCGGHIIDIYDGCIDEGIRIIDVRHEQVAAHAADGYARQTGKLGCVVTTAGPGCANAVTGIATAFRSESPVLHIGGQGALTQNKMGSLQDLPHVDIMSPITKFAATVTSTERVADMITMAVREAFNGAPGPVYLEIPRDVLDREVDIAKAVIPQPGKYRASTHSVGDPRDIENWPTCWSTPNGRQSSTDSRCGPHAVRTRRSRCCAGSISPGISMAPAAVCCRRAIRITSTGREHRRSRTQMCS
jgi:acetolactate synthase-1/2/3 large subunit